MRKLVVFNNVSLDGYFTDKNSDMSWAHQDDHEWNAFTEENAKSGGELVFGRVTYQMMASFWPTPQAVQKMSVVANHINSAPKVVFSRTLDKTTWQNTRLIKGDLVAEMQRLKQEHGPDLVIMGSGSIVKQLAQEGSLIDEYQIVVHPLVLGAGRTLFDGIREVFSLKMTKTRTFDNGNVLLYYEPKAST